MVDDFVSCKNARKPVTFSHPLLKPLLLETYGVMVYQEQILQLVQVLGQQLLLVLQVQHL
jgi:DNA polymerase-3 subunit alpha